LHKNSAKFARSARTLRSSLIALFFVAGMAQTANATPVHTHSPIRVKGKELHTVTIANLIVKAAEVPELLEVNEKFRAMFLDEMRSLGYRALGDESLALNRDKSGEAEFALGGTLTEATCQDNLEGTCGITIEWELMDRQSEEVLYKVVTRHEESQLDGVKASVVAHNLLLGAFRSLLSRPKFVAALRQSNESSSKAEPEFRLIGVRSCPARSLSMPKMSDETLKATALVTAGEQVGSAVVISPDGLLLTAAHVAATDEVKVQFKNGDSTTASVLRRSAKADVALLQLKDRKHASCLAVRLRDPETGEDVFALGAPGGEKLSFSVTRGIVSGRRTFESNSFVQTDASLSPGNSGGPFVDAKGEVLAIASFKLSGRATEGLGFGVPSETALRALGIEMGDATGTFPAISSSKVQSRAPSLTVDAPDPRWFYVGDHPRGKRPGWVTPLRAAGYVSAVVGSIWALTATASDESAAPGFALLGAGTAAIIGSYVFGGQPKPPGSAALQRQRLSVTLGAPHASRGGLTISGAF
jgi:serine protease Do